MTKLQKACPDISIGFETWEGQPKGIDDALATGAAVKLDCDTELMLERLRRRSKAPKGAKWDLVADDVGEDC